MNTLIITEPRTTGKMASEPTLMRCTPASPSLRESVAGQIRYECGANNWTCIELADILNVSVDRARHLHAGRRPALLDELELLCRAADTSLVEFMEQAIGRRNRHRVFADTTVRELAEMATEAGTTPDRILRSQGWYSRTRAETPAHLGGDA